MCHNACDFDPSKLPLVLTDLIEKLYDYRSVGGGHLPMPLSTIMPDYLQKVRS